MTDSVARLYDAVIAAQLADSAKSRTAKLMRAGRALAALEGAGSVSADHIARVAPLALRHRLRRGVLDETGSTVRIERALEDLAAA